MKKFIILLLFLGIFVQCTNAEVILKCSAETSSVYGGECVISGSGRLTLDKPIQADKLIVANATFNPADKILALYLTGQNHINEIIIMREGGTDDKGIPAWLELSLRSDAAAIRPRSIRIENLTKSANVKTPYYLRLPDTGLSTLVNQDGVQTGQYGAYIPTRNTGTSGGGAGGSGNTGGEFTPPENATPEQLLQSVIKYAQSLNEQLHLESTNTLILYNILNNYDGTYINYDYGLGHQVGVGAFNNGGFARYYNYNSKNGFDIGAKLKIAVANRLYLRGVAYYTYFGSSTLASHSLVFGLGVLKNFDFALGSSGNVFWVLNPSANLYYAATLKGTYMPANHLGFGNVALDTGVRIKNTSLLLRGSAGGVLNSLKSISIDLGNGANYKNTTFFNNAIYSASFVFSQKFPLQRNNNKLYLNADIGGVFVDRVLDIIEGKPYILKAGMLLGYEFGGDSNRATRQSSRYQKLKNKNARKTLSTPTSNQTTTNNKRATSLAPNSTTNATKSTPPAKPATLAKTPVKDSSKSQKPELTKAEKKAQKQAQKEAQKAQKKAAKAAKSTPTKSTPPKINLPKVPKSKSSDSTKQPAKPIKQNTKPTKPAKTDNAKSSTKSNATKPSVAKPAKPTKPAKSTKPTTTKLSTSAKPTRQTKPTASAKSTTK